MFPEILRENVSQYQINFIYCTNSVALYTRQIAQQLRWAYESIMPSYVKQIDNAAWHRGVGSTGYCVCFPLTRLRITHTELVRWPRWPHSLPSLLRLWLSTGTPLASGPDSPAPGFMDSHIPRRLEARLRAMAGHLPYRKISNIRRTKSPNLNVSRLALGVVFAQSNEARC